MFRMLFLVVIELFLTRATLAAPAQQAVNAGITDLAYAAQPDSSLYVTGKYQGKPVNLVRSGAMGSGKWTLYSGVLTDRLRFTFDDRKGLQEILAMDKGQRITLNALGQERVEYRLYAPDRSFIVGSVLYRKDGRWLQGLMRSEAFPGYAALSDVSDVTATIGTQTALPASRVLVWLKGHWHGISLISSAHAVTGDDLIKGFFGDSAQDARGFFGAPLDEMWKGALVGAGAFTVKLAGQMIAAGETVGTGTALVAAAPFLVAVGTGVAIGLAADKVYNWAEAKNLGGSASMRDAYNRLVAGTRFSKEAAPKAPGIEMAESQWPQQTNAPVSTPRNAPASRSQMSLLDMADKLDNLDKQDMSSALEAADQCTSRRDFDCTNAQLTKAAKFANGSSDKLALERSRQKVTREKALIADEERRREEQERQAQLARQREQERVAQERNDSGFQWGKAAALIGGSVIGGLGKLGAADQVKVISGIVQDSQAGQTGISNFQASVNNPKAGGAGNAGSSGQGSMTAGVSKEAFNAGELACQKEADRTARPYGDSQLDTLCVLASSNACVKRKFNFDGYEAERRESCSRMKSTARALNLNPNLCGACQ